MKPTALLIAGALVAALSAASAASAHHSGAMYDRDKTVTVQGTVKSWSFQNPHAWLEVVGAGPDGAEKLWGVEGSGASALIRAGMKRNSFLPGDKVAVRLHPLKDGRPGGGLVDVTKADGSVFGREGI